MVEHVERLVRLLTLVAARVGGEARSVSAVDVLVLAGGFPV
jgi:hypothetical protein